MIQFNPRAMMELAVEEMRRSKAEHRDDGKISPKVGAVLLDLGDTKSSRVERIQKAHRGELREGDHAEFTLLERKNRDRALDQCILFATLEPCAPGARKHPKLGCAERIVLARIKRVWIGIEDPDPTVARKGIEYLRSCGVEVLMFDRDLQETIRSENKAFLEQALQRAEEAKQPRDTSLSPLELPQIAVDWSDFSSEALDAYRIALNLTNEANAEAFQRRLLQQGILKDIGGTLRPSGFGNILFGENPRISTPQAGLLATIHYKNGKEEVKDFESAQVLVPTDLIQWLRDKLPNVTDRSNAKRSEPSAALFELVREGIVNAIVHRDYSIDGAKCQVQVYPNRIEIFSPGSPVAPITLEQIRNFDAPMLSRNPILHFVFAKMGLAEERGLGLKSLKASAGQMGLPLPTYSWQPPYLVLSIFLTGAGVTDQLPKDILSEMSDSEVAGFQWLASVGAAKAGEYATARNVDSRTARRHLKLFVELGLAETTGSGPTLGYRLR